MEKFKNLFGSSSEEQNEETGIVDELWKNTTLSWSTRIKGFIIFFVIGYLISFISTGLFWSGIASLVVFAVLYTVGNICSMCSTLFLMGPVSQLKKMFATTRIIATIVVLTSFVLTLLCAFFDLAPLCLLCIIIQFFAMLWYSLSYIPFARDAVKKFAGAVLDV